MTCARPQAREELMGPERCKRVREHRRAVSGWPIWQLRPWLVTYIGLITTVYVAAIAVAVAVQPWPDPLGNLWLFGALLLCNALYVVTRSPQPIQQARTAIERRLAAAGPAPRP